MSSKLLCSQQTMKLARFLKFLIHMFSISIHKCSRVVASKIVLHYAHKRQVKSSENSGWNLKILKLAGTLF